MVQINWKTFAYIFQKFILTIRILFLTIYQFWKSIDLSKAREKTEHQNNQDEVLDDDKMLLKGDVKSAPVKSEEHFLQSVPVKVKCQDSVQAKVKPFFVDYIQENNGGLSTILRGRPLDGKVSQLTDFKAVVVKVANVVGSSGAKASDNSQEDEQETVCHAVAQCDKMTVWNYDMPQDQGNDILSRGLQYARLAKVLHSDDS